MQTIVQMMILTGVLVLSVVQRKRGKIEAEPVHRSEGHVWSKLYQSVDQQPAVVQVLSHRHLRSRNKVLGRDVNLSPAVELFLITVGTSLNLLVRLPDDTPHHLLKVLGLVTVSATNIYFFIITINVILKYLPFFVEQILDPRMGSSTML